MTEKKCIEITNMRYNAHFSYPSVIEIIFSDGTKRWYRQ